MGLGWLWTQLALPTHPTLPLLSRDLTISVMLQLFIPISLLEKQV